MDWKRNNLDTAVSPYLTAHQDNPVWWQEWSAETLARAKQENRPVFVSVGYSTCHWCHVMAREAFSDSDVAAALNRSFVSIKVDREERPDIDRYLMSFLVATTGSGGWPLNAFLTPDGTPFFAMTYAPARTTAGRVGLVTILEKVAEHHAQGRAAEARFDLPATEVHTDGRVQAEGTAPLGPTSAAETDPIVKSMLKYYDGEHAGFGTGQKFPPHSTLLFLLYRLACYPDQTDTVVAEMIHETLGIMAVRGLHDHLEGGFFRYCVDRRWTIPHFEKMLYDQAMCLWNYALAARLFDNRGYASVAESIVDMLDARFALPESGGLYASSLDADTEHEEGATYVFSHEELRRTLTEAEHSALESAYEIPAEGNFEGRIHLVRRGDFSGVDRELLAGAENKLARLRAGRPQPAVDRKALTSWNALAACAFLNAGRLLGREEWTLKGRAIIDGLMARHLTGEGLVHASLGDRISETPVFLADYGALLLAVTYAMEEDPAYEDAAGRLAPGIDAFRSRDTGWLEARGGDFRPVPADDHDAPSPSGPAMAELALTRLTLLKGSFPTVPPFGRALSSDFRSLARLSAGGGFYVVGAPDRPAWSKLPVATIYHRAETPTNCKNGICTPGLPQS